MRHFRTKHINVQHQFIREKLEIYIICWKHCPMDVLTKTLANERHQALRKAMGLQAFSYLQSGSVED
jgi:hypothetical protein